MKWAVFYVDPNGVDVQEVCADWASAHEVLLGFISMVNPPKTEITFSDLARDARPDRTFHATDGVHSFAIESLMER